MSMYGTDSRSHLNESRDMIGAEAGCWKRRSGVEKKMVFVIAFLVVVAISLGIALGVVNAKLKTSDDSDLETFTPSSATHDVEETTTPSSPTQKPNVCLTEECKKAAVRIKRNMDETASPCDDFYQYVCGGWMNTTVMPEDKSRWGVFDELRDQLSDNCIELLNDTTSGEETGGAVVNARSFFGQCVKTDALRKDEGVKILKTLLTDIGGTPLIPDSGYDGGIKWHTRVATVRRSLGMSFLMNFQVGIDAKNPANYIIYLDQVQSLGLARLFLLDLEKYKVYVDAYKRYIKSSFCLIKVESGACDVEDSKIDDVVHFESTLAQFTRDPVLRRDPNALYNPMTLGELQHSTTDFPTDWPKHINDILQPTGLDNVTGETTVIVREEDYLKNMTTYVEGTNIETVANYIAWRVLQGIGPYSSKEFRDNEFKFQKVTSGIEQAPSIDDKCFAIANDFYGYAVGRLYVEKHFSKEARDDMIDMEKNIADAFRELLKKNNWMDSQTKTQAEKKLEDMVGMIAYPEWIEKPEELNSYYSYLENTYTAESYIGTLRKVIEAASTHQLKKLNQHNNRTSEWISPPTIVNAFYSPTANSITFPAGILQPPFYQHNTMNALNYGAIGYVIGHEITHGYDDQGSQYNGEGKLESWWSKETSEKYNEKKNCFIDQYSSQTVEFADGSVLNLKGNQTIGENIADNGGIREAFQAFLSTNESDSVLEGLEYVNSKKLFFIAAANVWCSAYRDEAYKEQINNGVHSPGKFRATIPLSNTVEFAEVFDCTKGSAMDPENKCVLW